MKLWATMSLVSPLQQLLSSRRCSRWKKFKIPWDNKWPWNHGYRLCCSNLKTSVSLEYMYKFALLCTNIIFNVTKRTFMFKTVGAIWTARWNGRFDWGSGKFSGRGADKPPQFLFKIENYVLSIKKSSKPKGGSSRGFRLGQGHSKHCQCDHQVTRPFMHHMDEGLTNNLKKKRFRKIFPTLKTYRHSLRTLNPT